MLRTPSIDLLRGLIMILMALDHASAMVARVHFTEIWGYDFEPYPSFAWWLTRFLSHLCAPGFFFLMGMSIVLFTEKRISGGWKSGEIRNYFLKRGGLILLLMVFLELPAWGLSIFFNQSNSMGGGMPGQLGHFSFPTTVLYGLGMCMLICAFLTRLHNRTLIAVSICSFLLSGFYINGLNPAQAFHPLEHMLLVPGISPGVMVIYPVLPWLGVTTFGMYWARQLISAPDKIYKNSLITGGVFIALFVILRLNELGNFHESEVYGWVSFFTLIKYPPSLTFILITCGINLMLLALFSKITGKPWLKPIKLFGQTAMFFYILHLYCYALLGAFFPNGTTVGWLYLLWLVPLPLLYFLCRWFLNFKRGKKAESLWRMI